MSYANDIHLGFNLGYQWLTTTREISIRALIAVCLELFIGKYLAVLSHDSGPLQLSPADFSIGWTSYMGIAYSPQIITLASLQPLYEQCCAVPGYDDIYVFAKPKRLASGGKEDLTAFDPADGRLIEFANLFAFALHDPSSDTAFISDLFWKQLIALEPESYIADGRDYLTVVSKVENFTDRVTLALSHIPAFEVMDGRADGDKGN